MFAGIAHCECGEKMYVPSNSPKYVCGKCRNKIAIVDLEGIFCDELQGYSFSADKIKAYLEKADETLVEKQRLLELQRSQLQKTRAEIERVYKLYQDGQLDSAGFGKSYKPLEDRTKQLEADLPRLQAEIDVGRVQTISAEEIVSEAQNLHRL